MAKNSWEQGLNRGAVGAVDVFFLSDDDYYSPKIFDEGEKIRFPKISV